MTKRTAGADPAAVDAYIDATPEPARARLRALADIVRAEAPEALERIAYGLATWHHRQNLLHLGAFAHHVGIYPGSAAIVAFAEELHAFKTSKGAIQVPHDAPLPTELVRRLTRWRLDQVASASPRRAAESYPRVEVRARAELRAWLAAEHATSRGAWVVTWKKHIAAQHVDAAAVAEEALCFGWIDSLPRALDADRSMLLVTPRKPSSAWSAVNKQRVERLLASGAITPAGLAVIEAARRSGTWTALDAVETLVLPPDLIAAFASASPVARANFDAFPRSAKRGILEWIQTAKRPETRTRRITETVTLAAQNQRANQWRP
jgi:uncharacterized protein YdeI (YjbR/CyaY-like superfamily)/uncharacterized protein YdhG (YjbR/CyaY superfamily)